MSDETKRVALPEWVLVDELGTWDQLVEKVRLWPPVVEAAKHAQAHLAREPVLQLVLTGARLEFGLVVAHMQDALARVDWSEIPPRQLVELLRRFLWTLSGVRCLAEVLPRHTADEEVEQFYDMLLVRGALAEAGGQLRVDEDFIDLARFAAIGHLTIPYVADELVRRGRGHKPGVAAAMLLGLPDDAEPNGLEEARVWGWEYLLYRIRMRFPTVLRGHGEPIYQDAEKDGSAGRRHLDDPDLGNGRAEVGS